jgi:hypothetical protein
VASARIGHRRAVKASALVALRAQGGIRDVRLYGKTLLIFARATSIKPGISGIDFTVWK